MDPQETLGPWRRVAPVSGLTKDGRADDLALALWTDGFHSPTLFIGELSPKGQRALIEARPQLRARFLFTGLPDSGAVPSVDFIEHLEVEHIILNNHRWPWAKFGGPERLRILRRNGRHVWETATHGAIALEMHNGRLRLCAPNRTLWTDPQSAPKKSPRTP